MIKKYIYLDNAATTFPKPDEVYHAMDYANRNLAVNAGRGSYELAKKASDLIEDTREKLRKLCACNTSNVAFTSSATAAINLILRGIDWSAGDVIYASPYEHNAVMRTLHALRKDYGILIEQIPINTTSLEIDLEKTEYLFSQKRPRMVCVTHVSNVTGYILPLDDIALLAKKYEAITMIDGAQALGLIPFILNEKIIDFYVFAGHKTLYGPLGIAGFYYNPTVSLKVTFTGGTGSESLSLEMPQNLPLKYEASSQNIVAIAGLNAALKHTSDLVNEIYFQEKEKTNYLVSQIRNLNDVISYIPNNFESHIGIVSLNITGYSADGVGMILDQDYNIAVRTGYHCAPQIHHYLGDIDFGGTVRISLSQFTVKAEINRLIEALKELTIE